MTTGLFNVVIPARYASTRFPGKAIAELDGKPIIRHVYDQACSSSAGQVVIATDDERIASVAKDFGADVAMTRADHESGTDRISAVAQIRGWSDDSIIVNVQGDAPLIRGSSIDQVAALLAGHESASLATLCAPLLEPTDVGDPNIVKVVFDAVGRALYFSRSPIPAVAQGGGEPPANFWWHVGIYAYRVAALLQLARTPVCGLEHSERLEQLRALYLGMEIRIAVADALPGPDINTPEDLLAAERFIAESRSE